MIGTDIDDSAVFAFIPAGVPGATLSEIDRLIELCQLEGRAFNQPTLSRSGLMITIATGNAAFCDPHGDDHEMHKLVEVCRILSRVRHSSDVSALEDGIPLRDANGNKIGSARFRRSSCPQDHRTPGNKAGGCGSKDLGAVGLGELRCLECGYEFNPADQWPDGFQYSSSMGNEWQRLYFVLDDLRHGHQVEIRGGLDSEIVSETALWVSCVLETSFCLFSASSPSQTTIQLNTPLSKKAQDFFKQNLPEGANE